MHEITNKVDFYITNVCNLTCDQCNRFNNHDFRGWQRWSDYESAYEQWGKLTQLTAVTIMGGEPFLNPTLTDWVQGINRIFGIEVQVLTNGTRFKQAGDLYNAMLYRSSRTGAMNHIGVSLHNLDDQEQILTDIREFLQAPIKEYTKANANNFWNSDWFFIDANGVMVNVYIVNQFTNSSIQTTVNSTGRFFLHNSDPATAHNSCAFVQFKSYHFIRGKLYKCGPVALMPEFDQQHQFEISESDRELLNSYQALSADNFDQYHREFFDNIDNPIAQCKFCPSKSEFKMIAPIRKGK
jgi:organic radical activating enzyme